MSPVNEVSECFPWRRRGISGNAGCIHKGTVQQIVLMWQQARYSWTAWHARHEGNVRWTAGYQSLCLGCVILFSHFLHSNLSPVVDSWIRYSRPDIIRQVLSMRESFHRQCCSHYKVQWIANYLGLKNMMVRRAFLSLSNYAKEFRCSPPSCKANTLHLIFETLLVSHSQLIWISLYDIPTSQWKSVAQRLG